MQIILMPEAKADLDFWIKSGNKPVLKKIAQLLESVSTTPYEGIGKPEPLKYSLMGCWSRRIDQEHRIVYEVHSDKIIVLSLKGHY
ncbi:MAG: toxin of toxin-antitoxin system [Bacteroidetes bacterium GWF2_42_66]|nr:MAG: toxin of toxin-antitoxin system [Bacteroidetes bacterium GWA2_42_15]OFX96302.1 MAG: toxin of toxin-antitoxin system [Bacteroidetes bacterium GWE2_42_39]OFY46341.1 MAG: toxin of toxin-antitoxin system [Bacteroidetes bacterium GWF2_42_66]HAZ03463.1 Txe/YoeB family addiction module toxin [Marinilabiliales bacterium]HBL78273.1 Txe/YoeB family addiction module toxin [Prolixibacteraceae bacterium]